MRVEGGVGGRGGREGGRYIGRKKKDRMEGKILMSNGLYRHPLYNCTHTGFWGYNN